MRPVGLLESVRDVMHLREFSNNSVRTYLYWIERFLHYHDSRQLDELNSTDINDFLRSLTANNSNSAATQSLAIQAILFLYRAVLKVPIDWVADVNRPQKLQTLPVVLTRNEVASLMNRLHGVNRIVASLMYGAGLRLQRCLNLRVRDLDFQHQRIVICDRSGNTKLETVLPGRLVKTMQEHLVAVREVYLADREDGLGIMTLPYSAANQHASISHDWQWQFVFPASRRTTDSKTGTIHRPHLNESCLQRAVKQAAADAGINRHVGPNTLRQSWIIHLLERGYNVSSVNAMLGNKDIRTTKGYARMMDNE